MIFLGKDAKDCGKVKDMVINPCRRTGDTFTRLASNSIGDPYVDPGQYYLRRANSTAPSKPFVSSGSNKLVRKSEFEHMHNGAPPKNMRETLPGFHNRKNFLPFT